MMNLNNQNEIFHFQLFKINLIGYKIEIQFYGSGFLRYQVRNMVGVLIEIGEKIALKFSFGKYIVRIVGIYR